VLIALVAVVAPFILRFVLPAGTPRIRPARKTCPAASIAELEKLPIGGSDQWVLQRSENIDNPVILFLHGGPGTSQLTGNRRNTRELEKSFIVVNWDQRGAGKSYGAIRDAAKMNIDQFVEDTKELTLHLLKKFNKRRIVLAGHSWGSAIGAMAVAKYPELYSCFVGIGQPSAACNLARLTHAPGITLIYESGTLATKPNILPLSIGDGELCETALTTVSVPEMFRYWLQGGRIKVGFLGGAQIDKYGNLNTTVVGPYDKPKVRLPGGGGAPEIATSCGEIFIIMAQGKRSFVDKLDFVTSIGHVSGGDSRAKLGVKTKGPTKLITDLALFEPDPKTKEMIVVSIHPGVTREQIQENTGWKLGFAAQVAETPPPTTKELEVLRELHARTNRAHSEAA